MINYKEQVNDPRWVEKSREIMKRDNFTCQLCGKSHTKLNVHHIKYIKDKDYWDYPDELLMTVCEVCHQKIHGKYDFSKNKCKETNTLANVLDLEYVCTIWRYYPKDCYVWIHILIYSYLIENNIKYVNDEVKKTLSLKFNTPYSQICASIRVLIKNKFIQKNKVNIQEKVSNQYIKLFKVKNFKNTTYKVWNPSASGILFVYSIMLQYFPNKEEIVISESKIEKFLDGYMNIIVWKHELKELIKLGLVERIKHNVYRIKLRNSITENLK